MIICLLFVYDLFFIIIIIINYYCYHLLSIYLSIYLFIYLFLSLVSLFGVH